MTPLERAEQALDGWAWAPCPQENPDCPGGLDCPVNKRAAARAVLTAIREPSEEMVKAGEAWRDHCSDIDSLFEEMMKVAIHGSA